MTDWFFHLNGLLLWQYWHLNTPFAHHWRTRGSGKAARSHRECVLKTSRHENSIDVGQRTSAIHQSQIPPFPLIPSFQEDMTVCSPTPYTQVVFYFACLVHALTFWWVEHICEDTGEVCSRLSGAVQVLVLVPKRHPHSSDPKQVLSHRQGWVIPGLVHCVAGFLRESWGWLQSDPCFAGWMCLVSNSHASKDCFWMFLKVNLYSSYFINMQTRKPAFRPIPSYSSRADGYLPNFRIIHRTSQTPRIEEACYWSAHFVLASGYPP